MRKLPVYFVIDVSESMVGEPIAEVEKGMHLIMHELLGDPYALETVYIGVIAFAGNAINLVPLTEIIQFQAPKFGVGSGTALGSALNMLMDDIDKDVQKTTPEKKGDWKPIIFLFTDGAPTDNPQKAIERWNKKYRSSCNLLGITFGNHADIALLESFCNSTLTLTDLGGDSFREFFKWVSASIKVSSLAVSENGNDDFRMGRSSINLEKADASTVSLDEHFVILPARCQQKGESFLIKYAKNNDSQKYDLIGAFPIDGKFYVNLGGGKSSCDSINSALLAEIPDCPYCGASGMVVCNNCGQLFCFKETRTKCPACGAEGMVGGAADVSVARGRG